MKKIFAAMAVLALGLSQANAQTKEGVYFSLNTGYNFSNASQKIASNNTAVSTPTTIANPFGGTTTSNITTTTTEAINASFGKGINLGAAVGYMFNKNIGAELGLNYLMGGEIKSTNKSNSIETATITSSASMFQIKPTFVLNVDLSDKLAPYAKFGAVIGMGSITTENKESYLINSSSETTKTSGDLAFGFHAAAGVAYKINKNLSAFGELSLVSMNYSPSKSSMTNYTVNGVNRLSEVPTSYKETVYEDKITTTYGNNTNRDLTKPSQELKPSIPMSSIGINVGIKYSL